MLPPRQYILLKYLFSLSFITLVISYNVTILHVTDIHGWIDAHSHNTDLCTDYGDFQSLLDHMKANYARENSTDFLVFDTGDLIEGTGLSDITPVHGTYIYPILHMMDSPFDGMTVGNHDIGHNSTVELLRTFISGSESIESAYVCMNLFNNAGDHYDYIHDPSKMLFSKPYFLRTLSSGLRIMTLGFIYNFDQNSPNTFVQSLNETVLGTYFNQSMKDSQGVDLIIVLAHIDMNSQSDQLEFIFQAIRNFHPKTPLAILSGHGHILNFTQYDENSFTIESGCFFEEFATINFTITDRKLTGLTYAWDNTTLPNFRTLAQTPINQENFDTKLGIQIKDSLSYFVSKLGLETKLGCNPYTLWVHFYPPDPKSIYTFQIEQVFPDFIFNTSRPNIPLFFTGDGTLRYPLYSGEVLVNDIFTTDPFSDSIYYYSLNGADTRHVLELLNTPQSAKDYRDFMSSTFDVFLSDDDESHYWYNDIIIQDNKQYDLLCVKYICNHVLEKVNQIVPNSVPHPYPTPYDTTTALKEYVKKYFSCE